jgi:predicted DNA-binding transcriptional regulator
LSRGSLRRRVIAQAFGSSTPKGMTSDIDLRWVGPFGWPGFATENGLPALDKTDASRDSGVYLWTVEHRGGYLIYAAGITRRTIRRRFLEHSAAYRDGVYTVFNVSALQRGVREKVWLGFWFRQRTPEKQREYERRRDEIQAALQRLLVDYRILVAPVPPVQRTLARLEAAIVGALYAAGGAPADVPDRGMALAPRWPSEPPIVVRSYSPVLLHGIPPQFEA